MLTLPHNPSFMDKVMSTYCSPKGLVHSGKGPECRSRALRRLALALPANHACSRACTCGHVQACAAAVCTPVCAPEIALPNK